MASLRRHEGYLLIDHRASPGVTASIQRFGKAVPVVGEGQVLEAATITCAHCHVQMIVNPARTRARGYCPKCDHYVCDGCEAARVASGGACRLLRKVLDQLQEQAAKAGR